MTVPIRAVLADGVERLGASGIESARLDARLLLAHVMGTGADSVLAGAEISPELREAFDAVIARRAGREPLAYITGTKEFWSLPFAVGPGVLIPRPETETLIEEALRTFPDGPEPLRVLDIGTGCGCLLITFLASREAATGLGIDASEAALAYARQNALNHVLQGRSRFLKAEWDPADDGLFDVILSNPPYLSDGEFARAQPEIRNHEPSSAFAAGADGLAGMRALGPVLARHLTPRGLGFIEQGRGQTADVTQILASNGLEVFRLVPDLSGVPRCLVVGRAREAGPQAPTKIHLETAL